MTTDEMQLLRDFRKGVPAPDEETMRRAYAYATSRSRTSFQEWLRRLLVPPLRLRFALPAAAVICAGVVAAIVFSGSSGSSHPQRSVWSAFEGTQSGAMTLVAPPTLAHPLPEGQQTTLDAASAAWGSPLVLPNTTLVQPSDAGSVWVESVQSKTVAAAVSFPSQGVIVMYLRPTFSDPQTQYREMAQGINQAQEINLNGTPALVIAQNSDSTGQNFGVADFQANGSEIAVMGHYDTATIESLALSIINQSRESR